MTDASGDLGWSQLFGGLDRTQAALQSQIRQSLVAAIESGRLSRGTRLPASRQLAAVLGIARNTVVLAYERLVDEGYLVAEDRSGVYVAASAAPAAPRMWGADGAGLGIAGGAAAFGVPQISKPRDWQSYPYPFLFGQFDPALFPVADWRESVAAASSVSNVNEWAADLIDEDDPELVAQIRTQVLTRRGIWAAADEVMITLGGSRRCIWWCSCWRGVGDGGGGGAGGIRIRGIWCGWRGRGCTRWRWMGVGRCRMRGWPDARRRF